MPSLKDLRNRIASVKATQKITKAMQMVAAAKLRRAQSAAEAARPYASRMETVLANLATALQGRDGSSPLMVGTGKDQVHLLIVCTAERGLCGAFNSSIVRLTRDHAYKLINDGKQIKILCVGKKGFDQLKRLFASQIIEVIELRGVKQIGFKDAERIAERVLKLFAEGQFDVAGGIVATASRTVLERIADGATIPRILGFAGYAGWASGQLEGEIRGGSWLPSDVDPSLIFEEPVDEIWERAYKRLSTTPIAFVSRTVGSA